MVAGQLANVRFVRRACTPRTLAIVRLGAEEGATPRVGDRFQFYSARGISTMSLLILVVFFKGDNWKPAFS